VQQKFTNAGFKEMSDNQKHIIFKAYYKVCTFYLQKNGKNYNIPHNKTCKRTL